MTHVGLRSWRSSATWPCDGVLGRHRPWCTAVSICSNIQTSAGDWIRLSSSRTSCRSRPGPTARNSAPGELHQARAVLGAVQWHVYQAAPQHAAKLGYFQSMLTKGDRVHAGGHQQDDTGSACSERVWLARMPRRTPPSWPDAALANRLDLGSIGGYIIGFVHRFYGGWRRQRPGKCDVMGKPQAQARVPLMAEAQALAEAEQELMYL